MYLYLGPRIKLLYTHTNSTLKLDIWRTYNVRSTNVNLNLLSFKECELQKTMGEEVTDGEIVCVNSTEAIIDTLVVVFI